MTTKRSHKKLTKRAKPTPPPYSKEVMGAIPKAIKDFKRYKKMQGRELNLGSVLFIPLQPLRKSSTVRNASPSF